MIRITLSAEPANFQDSVRTPGNKWLESHPNPSSREFPKHWNVVKEELRVAFNSLCAYSALRIFSGVVDHSAPKVQSPHLAYEWSNYRYADPLYNSRRSDLLGIDPCQIQDEWFEISLDTMRLDVTEKAPPAIRDSLVDMLDRMRLREGSEALAARRTYFDEYLQYGSLDKLRAEAPMVASAVEREGLQKKVV